MQTGIIGKTLPGIILLGLTACGGGGNDNGTSANVSCVFLNGTMNTTSSSSGACTGCEVHNPPNAADGNLNTSLDISTTTGQQTYAGTDTGRAGTFAAGSNAGVFVTLSGGASTAGMTLTTYLANVLQDTATGSTLTVTSTRNQATPASYVSFTTTRAFDSVGITINGTSGTQYSVYEFCGSATVR